jgi:hypothetical protein
MAEHAWTVLCQKVLVDSETNLFTLVDVHDRLIINPNDEMPDVEAKLEELHKAGNRGLLLPARIRIVMQWFRSNMSQPEQSMCRLFIEDPLGQQIFEQEIPIELMDTSMQRITLRTNQISVTALGSYWIVVEKSHETKRKQASWKEVARLPLNVVEAPKIGQD